MILQHFIFYGKNKLYITIRNTLYRFFYVHINIYIELCELLKYENFRPPLKNIYYIIDNNCY